MGEVSGGGVRRGARWGKVGCGVVCMYYLVSGFSFWRIPLFSYDI